MELTFRIHYKTQQDSFLSICGNIPELGNDNINETVAMHPGKDGWWEANLSVDKLPKVLVYQYYVHLQDGTVITEPLKHIHKDLPSREKIFFLDKWTEPAYSYVFLTHKAKTLTKEDIALVTQSGAVPAGCHVAVSGNSQALGMWDPAHALTLQYAGAGLWEAALSLSLIKDEKVEYKYIIRNNKDHSLVEWEEGENRIFTLPSGLKSGRDHLVLRDTPLRSRSEGLRHAGTAIPVFSLRSKNSWGIGDFGDLTKMADWAAVTGQRVLQILPVNDTTMFHNWIDSYPYGGISIMALHPLYADINAILSDTDNSVDLSAYQNERTSLNELPELDYDKVSRLKWTVLKLIFKHTGKEVMELASYKSFIRKNKKWLRPYALFCVLRDKFGTADYTLWGKYEKYDPVFAMDFDNLDLYIFVQYYLDKQLQEAHKYLNNKGVILKGDIPIGITPMSVEAWTEPHLFKMDSQAGAPPDEFSVQGQNWGFPTYNWEVMEKDGYAWWKNRFANMARYFDAYRIDHILGFFRIWTIPREQTQGLMGYFDPALPFTADEMQRWGLAFDYERMVKPYITQQIIDSVFNENASAIIEKYLQKRNNAHLLELKEPFNTQRKISDHFETLPDTEENNFIRNSLMDLVANVLFIPHPGKENAFHPRISAQFNYSYKALDEETKFAFNRLYDHFFYKRHNEFWYRQAMKKLPPLISATGMLCCAEDLGMIPDCVPPVMKELAMLSLEVQRMPKDKYRDFGDPAVYPYLCVCTTGSHDTSTLRGWWEEDRNITNRFFNSVMGIAGEAPVYCEPWICRQIIMDHLKSQSMLCILPWQDWMSVSEVLRRENPHDERINVPAIVPHYWKYRMHLTIEDLLKEKEFNDFVKEMITVSGR